MTLDLFGNTDAEKHRLQLEMPDADVSLWPALFSRSDSDRYFRTLHERIEWQTERISLYGKTHDVPRLTAWYGEPGKVYRYSGIEHIARPWTPVLLEIKRIIEALSPETAFNSVLLNLYRSGADCVAWHSDDEAELGPDPTIGSVSFGESRSFQLKHKTRPSERRRIILNHGDYLLMQGATQRHWLHQIPRSKRRPGSRINLTFRTIIDP